VLSLYLRAADDIELSRLYNERRDKSTSNTKSNGLYSIEKYASEYVSKGRWDVRDGILLAVSP
jgi:hypothetical protein